MLTHWDWDKMDAIFADDTFKRIFMNENVRISINISLKFVPKGLINNIAALVQIMAWRRPGDKPLSEPRMVNLLTHICVTRPQWVKTAQMALCYQPAKYSQKVTSQCFEKKRKRKCLLSYIILQPWWHQQTFCSVLVLAPWLAGCGSGCPVAEAT